MTEQEQKQKIERRRDCLKGLIDLHGGRLTNDQVIEAARDEASPLHDAFQWDIEKAAYAHWVDTARELIRSVTIEITYEETKLVVPYFVRDPEAAGGDPGYVETLKIRNDADKAKAALKYEMRQAVGHLTRAENLAWFFDLDRSIARVRKRSERLIEQIEKARPEV
jgi:hypothetical protein